MSRLDIEINNLTKARIDKKLLKEVTKKIFKFLKIKKIKEVSLVIVGDKQIKRINRNNKPSILNPLLTITEQKSINKNIITIAYILIDCLILKKSLKILNGLLSLYLIW